MNEPIQLVPTKPDVELANELKLELAEAAGPWLNACTKASKAGFVVQANFALNWAGGSYVIQSLQLVKVY